MPVVPAVAFADFVVALHILSAVVGFGVIFAFPLMFASASRLDPSVLPWLFGARQRAGRLLINPGLLVLVLAGIYLASDEHQWGAFYVQWGIAAAVVLGALEGSLVIRGSGRLAALAERDLSTTAVPAGGQRRSATWSPEYLAAYRRVSGAGTLMALIVIVTVFLMATHAGS
jgi:hypothetical protein